jgi:hypothetical protein
MLKRRNFARYNTIENVVPPLNKPTPFPNSYPQFMPEISTFQHDNFLRDANTYSTIDYQMFTNSISYAPGQYRKAMYQGIDLFRDLSEDFDWVELREDEDLIDTMRSFRRLYTDYYGYNEAEGELDTFILTYTPYRIWAEITRWMGSVYYYITGEQPQAAVFTYYYFYFYFLASEYIYEHVSLYFPMIKLISGYQLFSTFEGSYFNFYEIVLGCYLPIIFIFIFSQYHFFKSFYFNKSFFIFGHSLLLYFFLMLPVYVVTGYSSVFVFFTFCVTFCIFSVFYIFEIRPKYFEQPIFRGYSSYFLPSTTLNDQKLCLPIFYFYFRSWKKLNFLEVSRGSNKTFTKYPFTQNVNKALLHARRLQKLRLLEFAYEKSLHLTAAPSIPMMGLLFPKNAALPAYSFKAHKGIVFNYPAKDFMPFSELQDHEYYNEIDQERWPMHVRDFINQPGGFSHISFLDFVALQKGARSVDYQFTILSEEERDFYGSVPSKKLIEHLYPYAALNFWLRTIDDSSSAPNCSANRFFRFKDLAFAASLSTTKVGNQELAVIPKWLRRTISVYFKTFTNILDFITFYHFYSLTTPVSTTDMAVKLFEVNQILVKNRKLSYGFYKNLAIFFYRSLTALRYLNASMSLDESYYFTYLALLRQLEEIFFNLSQKQSSYSSNTATFRSIGLCLKVLRLKVDGFSRVII